MNTFPRRRPDPIPHTLTRIGEILGVPPLEADLEIRGLAPIGQADSDQLGLLADGRYLKLVESSRAGALLVSSALESRLDDGRPRIVVDDAHAALVTLLEHFHPVVETHAEIHPTAVLGAGVRLGEGVKIGPYAVLEDGVSIGDGATVGAHVVIGADAIVGDEVTLHPHAVLYPGTRLGDRVIVHAGACLGVDGFGYAPEDGSIRKVPQVGSCILEEDVEIGANTTVDRGSIGTTRIEAGAKLDNLVQLGHNVTVGRLSMLAAQVGVAGSTRIGAGVLSGGQVGIGGHVSVGDGARLAGQAGVTGDVPPGDEVMGFPARSRREFLRVAAAQTRLPDTMKRLKELERIASHLNPDASAGPADDPASS